MLNQVIIGKTLRVPRSEGRIGGGAAVARQLGAVLVGAGFTASRALMEHVSGLEPGAAMDLAVPVVGAVRELVGDHVAHNAYFINFPHGVPDTVDFWVRAICDALVAARTDPTGTTVICSVVSCATVRSMNDGSKFYLRPLSG